jgi:predicted ArsR family transcriptional regulator
MHTTTQSRILDYLRKHRTASVRELSLTLAMTGANIRHHLAVLESNGLIEFISQRREERGRPANIFGLSRRVLGDGLDELAGAMLNVWLRNATETTLEAGLRSLALQLGGPNLPGLDILLTHRLRQLVDRLNELHYQAHWEAGVNGPNIILGHCPYAAIIALNPELCRMDEFLLEQVIGSPVEQTAILQAGVKGYPTCAFQVTGKR